MSKANGLYAWMNMNPDIIPDKCPKNEACGTRSCIIMSSAQGAICSGTEKNPKSSCDSADSSLFATTLSANRILKTQHHLTFHRTEKLSQQVCSKSKN